MKKLSDLATKPLIINENGYKYRVMLSPGEPTPSAVLNCLVLTFTIYRHAGNGNYHNGQKERYPADWSYDKVINQLREDARNGMFD